jgi:type II secretory pathway component GspD/PulD (secretin)
VVLSVTPQVSADGIITMSISPSVTERTGQATSSLGDAVPILASRETDTLVRVREGETVVISGLLLQRVTSGTAKVPVLGRLPLLGGLFRQDSTSIRKTELVILLTPTIVAPASIAAQAAREQERPDDAPGAATRK